MYRNILSCAVLILSIGFVFHGYPNARAYNGPSVNLGNNPVVSMGGSSAGTLFTAPSDQMIVISDIVLTASGSSSWQPCTSDVEINSQAGTTLGSFKMTSDSNGSEGATHGGSTISHAFVGGIPVPAGENVTIAISGNCSVRYLVSGYYAQP